eukprot:410508-Prymnesium_polylepis.1
MRSYFLSNAALPRNGSKRALIVSVRSRTLKAALKEQRADEAERASGGSRGWRRASVLASRS